MLCWLKSILNTRIIVHPDDRWLLEMVWSGALFIDTALPFGLRSACKIFNAVADAVKWILKEAGISVVFHYLDDFLLIGAPNSTECAQALSILLHMFNELGLPVALDKLEGPWCNHGPNLSQPRIGLQVARGTPPTSQAG